MRLRTTYWVARGLQVMQLGGLPAIGSDAIYGRVLTAAVGRVEMGRALVRKARDCKGR